MFGFVSLSLFSISGPVSPLDTKRTGEPAFVGLLLGSGYYLVGGGRGGREGEGQQDRGGERPEQMITEGIIILRCGG